MIVDDSGMERKIVKDILLKYNFLVTESKNRVEALEKLEKDLPDLIILDIMMPGITAADFIGTIHENSSTNNLKIITLSSVIISKEDTEMMKETGMIIDYLHKPVSEKELIDKIMLAIKGV